MKKQRKAVFVAGGSCSRQPTEKDATLALATLARYLIACGASSVELQVPGMGTTITACVTHGFLNSRNGYAPTITA